MEFCYFHGFVLFVFFKVTKLGVNAIIVIIVGITFCKSHLRASEASKLAPIVVEMQP